MSRCNWKIARLPFFSQVIEGRISDSILCSLGINVSLDLNVSYAVICV